MRIEKMSDEFEKFFLEGPNEIVLHHFTGVDRDGPHDHPWDFTSDILIGGYVEECYKLNDDGTWNMWYEMHGEGDTVNVKAEHIHRIVFLLNGECVTRVTTGPARRDVRFWDFSGSEATWRPA